MATPEEEAAAKATAEQEAKDKAASEAAAELARHKAEQERGRDRTKPVTMDDVAALDRARREGDESLTARLAALEGRGTAAGPAKSTGGVGAVLGVLVLVLVLLGIGVAEWRRRKGAM